MTPGQLYPVDVEFTGPTSIVIPKGYRLALTIQGRDFGYGSDANIVQADDYALPDAHNSGSFSPLIRTETPRCMAERTRSRPVGIMRRTCCCRAFRVDDDAAVVCGRRPDGARGPLSRDFHGAHRRADTFVEAR
ncbi:hypothetical protein [Paraburkholderia sp. XV]|uniref:hypothetical protein n=1 Tax=Paraburkholderia sp. XV TaxID=2831520 RepID=UPI001CD7C87A|nr:hypothetical protein [Paraburkholderia sp. XV]